MQPPCDPIPHVLGRVQAFNIAAEEMTGCWKKWSTQVARHIVRFSDSPRRHTGTCTHDAWPRVGPQSKTAEKGRRAGGRRTLPPNPRGDVDPIPSITTFKFCGLDHSAHTLPSANAGTTALGTNQGPQSARRRQRQSYTGLSPPRGSPQVMASPNRRWLVLALCFVTLFGPYYCYDNPASNLNAVRCPSLLWHPPAASMVTGGCMN